MKVTFIHHSCFSVEIEDKVLIFDYFGKDRVAELQFRGNVPEYERSQKIYVFSSHRHEDHFDPAVLAWENDYPNVEYIFSKDIRLGENYLKRNGIDPSIKGRIHFIKANASLSLDGMEIQTLLSTDEGVAFLVKTNGKTIYHAGDLNWWHWQDEEAVFNEYQEKTYKEQIDKLEGRFIDAAFVVMDPRLEEARYWGIDYFMGHADAAHVFPMHLWQNFDLVKQYVLRPESAPFRERIAQVREENQVFGL